MNNKALTISLLMAGLAIFFIDSYVTSIEDEAKRKFGTEVLVVTAKRDLKEMETITETVLETKYIPKRFLEPAAISFEDRKADDKSVTTDLKRLSGAVVVVPIKKGEQITYNKFTEPSLRTGLAPQVAPGRRAVGISVSDLTAASKLVKPGDRVDVVAVFDMGAGKEGKIAKTVLQDAVVLSVGKNVTNNVARLVESDGTREKIKNLNEDSNFNTVTLEVEPTQAQTIALLQGSGDATLFLSLRHNDDTERTQVPAITLGDILGSDAIKVQRLPARSR